MLGQGRTEIINKALLYLGEDTILDPRGESKNAKLCDSVFDSILAEILSAHPWSFATVAVRLQQLTEAPKDARYQYQYQLPTDIGMIQQVAVPAGMADPYRWDWANSQPQALYEVQGDKLLSCNQPLQMLYTKSKVEPFEMPPKFIDYLATMIASALAYKIAGREREQVMGQRAAMIELEAKHADSLGTQDTPPNRPSLLPNIRRF